MKHKLVKRIGVGLLFMGCWALMSGVALAGAGGGGGARGGGAAGGGARGGGGGGAASSSGYATGAHAGTATFASDQETRTVFAYTDPQTAGYISNVISRLSRPAPQVLIKVVFVEASYNKGLDFGVEGGFVQHAGNNQFAGITTNVAPGALGTNLVTSFLPTRFTSLVGTNLFSGMAGLTGVQNGNGGIYSILGADYQATLHAIATAGKAEILSRPSILARNNQPATISLGSLVPIINGSTVDNFGNTHNTVVQQTVGISLTVTPFIFASGDMVEMQVTPVSSQLAPQSEWVPIGLGISSPVINSRQADTVVDVPNGQTVIIGGLMQKSTQRNQTKIPLLGDIPLLGALFRRTVNSDAKTELLIFLTPYVVQTPAQLVGLTDTERGKSELMPTGMSKQQLDRYLDGLPSKGSDSPKGNLNRDGDGFVPAPPPSRTP